MNPERVKIFVSHTYPVRQKAIEEEINQWHSENPSFEVTRVKATSVYRQLVVIIHYRKKEGWESPRGRL